MDVYEEATYGQRIAGIYDEWYSGYDAATIATLHELARGGRALELGIGTGRIALPLQQAGTAVAGVDISEAMVARLRRKPGGESIPVTMGSFADVTVEGQFSLVYVLFNTFFSLLTQDEQIRCFQNAARHLGPGGVFVMEAFVPDLGRFQGHQAIRAVDVGLDAVRIDVTEHDPVGQQVTSQHVMLSAEGIRLYPVKLRYAWPSELDLMARLAGLHLRQRWENWRRDPFSANSKGHISVYEQAPEAG